MVKEYRVTLEKSEEKFGFLFKERDVKFDATANFGGTGELMNPSEALLASISSCSGIHLIDEVDLVNADLEILALNVMVNEFSKEYLFKKINIHFKLRTTESDEVVEELIQKATKRCSMKKCLHPSIEFVNTFSKE